MKCELDTSSYYITTKISYNNLYFVLFDDDEFSVWVVLNNNQELWSFTVCAQQMDLLSQSWYQSRWEISRVSVETIHYRSAITISHSRWFSRWDCLEILNEHTDNTQNQGSSRNVVMNESCILVNANVNTECQCVEVSAMIGAPSSFAVFPKGQMLPSHPTATWGNHDMLDIWSQASLRDRNKKEKKPNWRTSTNIRVWLGR